MSNIATILHANGSKTIISPTGKRVHVGGRRPRAARGPRLRLAAYLDKAKLEAVPDVPYPTFQPLADVLGNDEYADCTCAGALHALEAINLAAGTQVTFSRDDALILYQLSCGFDPGNPQATDNGGDELAVLDFIAEKGIDGKGTHKTAGSILVDATDELEVRWCLYNLGQAYAGVGLPDSWINPFPAGDGFTWDAAPPDPNNGHCFVYLGSLAGQGFSIDTWGLRGLITCAASAQLAAPAAGGELHTIVTPELIMAASQKTPSGLAWQDLLADLGKLGALAA